MLTEKQIYKKPLYEAQEETGVSQLKPLKNILSLDILTVEGHDKNKQYVCPHLHFNVTYGFIASEKSTLIVNEKETEGVKWIPISEICDYCNEEKTIPIYQKIIKRVRS